MKIETKHFGSAVLYGVIGIFLIAIISSFIFSIILRFTSIGESGIQIIVTIVSIITIFAGGFISGGKGKQKGWLLGGLTGIVYSLIVFLFQFLGYDSLFNMQQVIFHISYILVAMMGGILGVNLTTKSRNS